MSSTAINTLRYARRQAAGVPDHQAEEMADALDNELVEQLATRDDLEKAVTKIEGTLPLMKWMLGFTLAFVVAIAWRVIGQVPAGVFALVDGRDWKYLKPAAAARNLPVTKHIRDAGVAPSLCSRDSSGGKRRAMSALAGRQDGGVAVPDRRSVRGVGDFVCAVLPIGPRDRVCVRLEHMQHAVKMVFATGNVVMV